MSERRSSRSHGSVKYAGFDDGDESDDDFAVSSHPAKKQKSSSSKTDEAAKQSNKSSTDKSRTLVRDVKKHAITSQNSTKTSRRAPLSEKVYERELQEALELSLFETGKSQDVVNHDLDNYKPQVSEALTSAADVITNSGQVVSSPGNMCAEPHSMKSLVDTASKVTGSFRFAHGTVFVDDSIELVESENANGSITQQAPSRRAHDTQSRKKPRLVDKNDKTDESDFNPDDDSDEDKSQGNTESEDEDDDETRSNTGRRSTKIKTVIPKRKNKSSAKSSKTSETIQIATVKGARKMSARPQPSGSSDMAASSASSLCSNSPPLSVTKSSAVGTKSAPAPKVSSQKLASSLVSPWKPPARGSSDQVSGATVRSPSSGLRLGLSRNQRVKPLHPSVQVV